MIEADKVKPNRLQDILFTGTGKKGDNYTFGPVVANSIKIWKRYEDPSNFVTVHLYGTILILYAEIVHLSNPLGPLWV